MVLRDRDANTDWDEESDGVLEERTYYCQNWRHDVVALIDDAGAQVQQVRYSAYGVPFGLPAGDVNSDGDVTSADDTAISNWISGSAYDVRGDMDLDGRVDNADRTALQSRIGDSLGRGVLALAVDHSGGGGGNRKGYAGYEGDFSRDGFWHVRHRVLDTELGRWTRRDPLGYVDGVSLYGYGHFSPVANSDPLGLRVVAPESCCECSRQDCKWEVTFVAKGWVVLGHSWDGELMATAKGRDSTGCLYVGKARMNKASVITGVNIGVGGGSIDFTDYKECFSGACDKSVFEGAASGSAQAYYARQLTGGIWQASLAVTRWSFGKFKGTKFGTGSVIGPYVGGWTIDGGRFEWIEPFQGPEGEPDCNYAGPCHQ